MRLGPCSLCGRSDQCAGIGSYYFLASAARRVFVCEWSGEPSCAWLYQLWRVCFYAAISRAWLSGRVRCVQTLCHGLNLHMLSGLRRVTWSRSTVRVLCQAFGKQPYSSCIRHVIRQQQACMPLVSQHTQRIYKYLHSMCARCTHRHALRLWLFRY